MAESVTLAYKRDGDLSTGEIFLLKDGIRILLDNFVRADFALMLRLFAKQFSAHPEARLFFQRTDRPGLASMQLSEEEEALFRSDPEEAIRQRMPEPRIVRVRNLPNNKETD